MTVLTRERALDLLGEVDDERLAELIATGASVEELGEAMSEVEAELDRGEEAPLPSTVRVAALRELLTEILLDARDDDA